MNRKLQNDRCAELARTYAESIGVPHFNLRAIEGRSPRSIRETGSSWRSYVAAAAIVIGLVAWAAPAMPALIADVQSAMQLFLERNGQMVQATDRVVTIDQAMRDLPFRVIPPNGVPLAASPTIREVSVTGDPASAQLLVQYSSNPRVPSGAMTAMPALTIVETAASSPEANIGYAVHPVDQPPMRWRPPNHPPPGAVRIQLLTEGWVSNGTRVRLLGTPGAITQAQLESIRRAMGG